MALERAATLAVVQAEHEHLGAAGHEGHAERARALELDARVRRRCRVERGRLEAHPAEVHSFLDVRLL